MEHLLLDLRTAVRSLSRSPGFLVAALLTLALGIGANSAIFTVVNAVLLTPLPYPEADRLVRLHQGYPERDEDPGPISLPDSRDWAEGNRTLEGLGVFGTIANGFTDLGGGEPREVPTAYVGPGFFATLGVGPELGAPLDDAHIARGDRAVVISHDFWQRRFGGDRRVVGTAVELSGVATTILGVMPPDFRFPDPAIEIWAPESLILETSIPRQRSVRWLGAVGRLRPGVTPETARDDLSAVAARLAGEYPDSNADATTVTVRPLRESLVGDVRGALLLLAGAAALVLLVASANVAHMSLARGLTRKRELAVRSAVGAGRGRLLSQLLTEAVVLTLVGGAVGLLIAVWGVDVLLDLGGDAIPRAEEVAVRRPVFLYTLGASLASAVVFGLVPALKATRGQLNADLRGAGGTERSRTRLRGVLVASEVALALLLVVGSTLLVKSFLQLTDTRPGFDAENLLVVSLSLSNDKYPDSTTYLPAYRQLRDELAALPGVESVATIKTMPFEGTPEHLEVSRAGDEPLPRNLPVEMLPVSPGAFETLRVPLLDGRDFEATDAGESPFVVLINREAAQRLYGTTRAAGRRLTVAGYEAEVIGVVEDMRRQDLGKAEEPVMFVAQEQIPRIVFTYLLRTDPVRTGGDPLAVAPAAREVIRRLEPGTPIDRLASMEELISGSVARPRFLTTLLTLFAALAMALAALGIGGVVAYSIRQRLREIAIRRALGARSGDVLRLVLGQGLAPVAVGLALGLATALPAMRVLETQLYQLSPLDPLSYVAAVGILGGLAVVACWLPARRALGLDPAKVLR